MIHQLKVAAEKAAASPFNIILTLTPEGIEAFARQGDREAAYIESWANMDRDRCNLVDWIEAIEAELREHRNHAIEQSAGVRPFRPKRVLP